MPKIVDHAQRRAEIVASTWRLIARQGFATTSLREINREMGHAYGAIGHYFTSKNELLVAAFNHVFAATNTRFAERGGASLHGIEALRALCEEVMPLDEERLLEARIVIPFWELTITDADFAAVHSKSMAQWSAQLQGYLNEAQESGDARSTIDAEVVAAQLVSMLMGMQILAVASPQDYPAGLMQRSFDDFVRAVIVA